MFEKKVGCPLFIAAQVLCEIKTISWCTYGHTLPWALILLAFEYFTIVSFSDLVNYFCQYFLSHSLSAASYFVLIFMWFFLMCPPTQDIMLEPKT